MVTHASACVGSWTNDAKRDVGEGGEEATHTDAGQITTSPSLDSSASTEHRSSSYSPRWYPPTGEPDAGDPPVRFGGRGRSHDLSLPLSDLGGRRPPHHLRRAHHRRLPRHRRRL